MDTLRQFIKEAIKIDKDTKLTDDQLFDYVVNNFYYEDVPTNALETIEDNIVNVGKFVLNKYKNQYSWLKSCDTICPIWSKIFKKAGIKHKIIYGYYWEADEDEREHISIPGSADHVWIEFPNGGIFDPTAIQFGNNTDRKYYIKQGEE